MKLGFCSKCGHTYNFAFVPGLMDYKHDYENSLHFSPRFQEYAEQLALKLIERYRLIGKDIIEIGCGDGDFLELLCRGGQNRCYGFDPSHVPDLDETGALKKITFIRDYYSEVYSKYKADLICCRHVLEHIPHPRLFLDTIRNAIGALSQTVVFFEVPNVMYTLKDMGIWDLIYEHCSYFSPPSLRAAFRLSGFEVLDETEAFEGQFLAIEARPVGETCAAERIETVTPNELKDYVSGFKENFTNRVMRWTNELRRMKKAGETAVIWGAGSKGATFLNTLKVTDQIEYVIDINPRKEGMYVSGTGQKIVAPEFLKNYSPNVVLIMNPIYADEIKQMLNDLNLSCEVRFV